MNKNLLKLLLIPVIFLIFAGNSFSAVNTIVFKDQDLNYEIKIPSDWTNYKSEHKRYFYGPDFIDIIVERQILHQAEKEQWQNNHLELARNIAQNYIEANQDLHNNLKIIEIKKYKKTRYKKTVLIKYEGTTYYTDFAPKKYRINQILTKKKDYLFLVSGKANKEIFKQSKINYFLPAFKSFKIDSKALVLEYILAKIK